ncbi:hypothetical protein BRX36_03150 [Sphingomonas sp. S-NIH.Pt1_0416]|nr:hypothetical protein BRX36_03150 [Sphingomonas sp. S-NIH.Pt1_0416]
MVSTFEQVLSVAFDYAQAERRSEFVSVAFMGVASSRSASALAAAVAAFIRRHIRTFTPTIMTTASVVKTMTAVQPRIMRARPR